MLRSGRGVHNTAITDFIIYSKHDDEVGKLGRAYFTKKTAKYISH